MDPITQQVLSDLKALEKQDGDQPAKKMKVSAKCKRDTYAEGNPFVNIGLWNKYCNDAQVKENVMQGKIIKSDGEVAGNYFFNVQHSCCGC